MMSKVTERMQAYFGERALSAFVPIAAPIWVNQGVSRKDAEARPVAVAVRYAETEALRAVFDSRVRIPDGKKFPI